MNIQTRMSFSYPSKPATSRSRPQHEAWSVGGQDDLSNEDVLGQSYREPTEATYRWSERRPAFSRPGALLEGLKLGAGFGAVFGLVGSALGALAGPQYGATFGALTGGGFGVALGVGMGVYDNLPTMESGEFTGQLHTKQDGSTEFHTKDPSWEARSTFIEYNDGLAPSRQEAAQVALAPSKVRRHISVDQHALAPVHQGDPKDAQEWWAGRFNE